MVRQAVQVTRVEIQPPSHKKQLPPVEVTVIHCEEIGTPKDEKPVRWTLLTSLNVSTLDDAQVVVGLYLARWGIETFFHVLKTGCGVEKTRLQSAHRLLPFVSLQLIVAWRVMLLTYLSRSDSELSCTCVFKEEEWRLIYTLSRKRRPPKTPPTLEYMVKLIATKGGYQGRKSDGPPGVMSIWRGLRYFDAAMEGAQCYTQLQRE